MRWSVQKAEQRSVMQASSGELTLGAAPSPVPTRTAELCRSLCRGGRHKTPPFRTLVNNDARHVTIHDCLLVLLASGLLTSKSPLNGYVVFPHNVQTVTLRMMPKKCKTDPFSG